MAANPNELTDDDLLAICHDEYVQAVGVDSDEELAASDERSLEYIKGEMADLPTLPNRSRAVSTDVSDAIETVLPDLIEIFTGGDDVVTFRPQGEEDVEAAAQETDFVNHVFFNENAGWRVLETMFRDGLSVKRGVVKVYGETYQTEDEERFDGKTAIELQMIQDAIDREGGAVIEDLIAGEPDPQTGEALWSFTVRRTMPYGKACVVAVPPEDFGFARDTVRLADATYCVMRSRPRAQALIADGYDPELVAMLSPYGSMNNEAVDIARDNAGEHNGSAVQRSSVDFNLHQVEIHEHYLRVDADGDGQPELWRIVTSADQAVMLKREQVDNIPFAIASPFLVSHRLIGRSLYDLLGEIQRIKTVLLRMMLDSGFFALNQRYEVATEQMNQFTLADLLNNIPGSPVRSKSGTAVRALGGGSLGFDVAGALEYASVMGEQRSGVVRNAQGLNPDSLHETKGGMEKLFNAAQKRVRMIARVLAETGVKDLFLLLHDVIRTTYSQKAVARLRNRWVEIAPTSWGVRNDMTIQVGVGSGGREMEIAALNMIADRQAQLVQLQGGAADGPWVTKQNIYNTMKRLAELAGTRDPDRYVTEPPADDPNAPKKPPPPDPEIVKAQMQAQRDREQAQLDAQVKRYEIDQKTQLQREQMAMEAQLKREQLDLEGRLRAFGVGSGGGPDVRFGGQPG